ncbi:ribose-phosphate pyrophosphokinase [Candidatus Rickettsiella viridis]|uniref:Ribose-phosphate pyrophosphokinase n=2 Tax=Candidatus Rickettsiella viridis TaxID=676208 RepID=A0A2Z5V422_9COXI|nr:ribose-phosphate pyrophosphokinase [Candidatus Rickettsiella viridis]
MSEMMIFTGNANRPLAEKVVKQLDMELGKATVGHFSDGEIIVEILENVRGQDVFVIQPTCPPVNNNLMELVIIADALRRASAKRITAVVPYFGYGRQDRRIRSSRVPITARVVADMMTAVGISRVLTVDLHADQIQGFFDIPVDNVYATPEILKDIQNTTLYKEKDPLIVVSPDVGGVIRARAIAKRLNDADIAIIDKRRIGPNKTEVMHVIGDVKDRNCLLVDDIVDTGGTLCLAAQSLKENGAKNIIAYCTHPVLSGDAIKNLEASCINELVVTDTIPLHEQASQCQKIRQLSLSGMLAKTICRINSEESVSSMFVD